jgi:hypothetical protein
MVKSGQVCSCTLEMEVAGRKRGQSEAEAAAGPGDMQHRRRLFRFDSLLPKSQAKLSFLFKIRFWLLCYSPHLRRPKIERRGENSVLSAPTYWTTSAGSDPALMIKISV